MPPVEATGLGPDCTTATSIVRSQWSWGAMGRALSVSAPSSTKPPNRERAADAELCRATELRITGSRVPPRAWLAAIASAAKPEALEASPAAVGKSLKLTTRARRVSPCAARSRSRSSVIRVNTRPLAGRPSRLASSVSRSSLKRTSVRVRRLSRVSDRLGTAVRFPPWGDFPQYFARAMFAHASARPTPSAMTRLPYAGAAADGAADDGRREALQPFVAPRAEDPLGILLREGHDAATTTRARQLGAEGTRLARHGAGLLDPLRGQHQPREQHLIVVHQAAQPRSISGLDAEHRVAHQRMDPLQGALHQVGSSFLEAGDRGHHFPRTRRRIGHAEGEHQRQPGRERSRGMSLHELQDASAEGGSSVDPRGIPVKDPLPPVDRVEHEGVFTGGLAVARLAVGPVAEPRIARRVSCPRGVLGSLLPRELEHGA